MAKSSDGSIGGQYSFCRAQSAASQWNVGCSHILQGGQAFHPSLIRRQVFCNILEVFDIMVVCRGKSLRSVHIDSTLKRVIEKISYAG